MHACGGGHRKRQTDTHRDREGEQRRREGEKEGCAMSVDRDFAQEFLYQVRRVVSEFLRMSIHIYLGCALHPGSEKSGALSRMLEWDNSGPSLWKTPRAEDPQVNPVSLWGCLEGRDFGRQPREYAGTLQIWLGCSMLGGIRCCFSVPLVQAKAEAKWLLTCPCLPFQFCWQTRSSVCRNQWCLPSWGPRQRRTGG